MQRRLGDLPAVDRGGEDAAAGGHEPAVADAALIGVVRRGAVNEQVRRFGQILRICGLSILAKRTFMQSYTDQR